MYSNCQNVNYLKTLRILIILSFVINSCILFAQRTFTIEGTIINDITTGTWVGIDIPRIVPTGFTFRNNTITSVNGAGYMLQAGDESPGRTNNNLAGEVITGNKFTWNGTDVASITHGVFTGYNINAIIKYNYLYKVPMSIIRKSNGMTNTSGGIAYNIVNNPPATAVVVKGMNDVAIYNNTFYSARTTSETWRGLIDIYTNTDIVPNGSATGTKIFNNIFYTKHQIANINVYASDNLSGFESDYNVFYCEDGVPMFQVAGVKKTFAQWQAMGYDIHSVVINPNFINFIDFVPATRLNYGTNLGATWQTGLSVSAVWGITDPVTTNQDSTWQVGARVFSGSAPSDIIPPTVSDFTIPTTATSLTVNITNFTATDNIAVTGYLLTETSSAPGAGSGSWASSIPTTFTFSSPGSKILYAWAKDAAGNVSASASATVTITLPDSSPPIVTSFVIAPSATSLTVNITNFTATDNITVTGYLLTETSSAPGAGSGSWASSIPTTFTFSSPGSKILYAWAKDAAGNVSASASATVMINGIVTESKIKIYPNPAYDFLNISTGDSILSNLIIKITNLSGKIVFIKSLEQGIKNIQIPKNIGTSLYVITLESGNSIRYSQKLIINQ